MVDARGIADRRPTRGAPRMRAMVTSLAGGLGVEKGPKAVFDLAFQVQSLQMRAINSTVWDDDQY